MLTSITQPGLSSRDVSCRVWDNSGQGRRAARVWARVGRRGVLLKVAEPKMRFQGGGSKQISHPSGTPAPSCPSLQRGQRGAVLSPLPPRCPRSSTAEHRASATRHREEDDDEGWIRNTGRAGAVVALPAALGHPSSRFPAKRRLSRRLQGQEAGVKIAATSSASPSYTGCCLRVNKVFNMHKHSLASPGFGGAVSAAGLAGRVTGNLYTQLLITDKWVDTAPLTAPGARCHSGTARIQGDPGGAQP